ncbi:MAG TPA: CHAD domain-containing protein [Solirubrobacterales bacterium]
MAPEQPGESGAYRLKHGEDVAGGLRRVGRGRAEAALERLRGVEPGGEDFGDAVHGARKDMKKLRAVVRLLREPLGEGPYAEENARYREAGRALSASRDAQVMVETLDALADRSPGLPAAALDVWRGALRRDREQVAATDAAGVARAIELIEPAPERIAAWPLDGGGWKLIDAGLRRAYRRGRAAMEQAREDGRAESFHQWRKRAKDLWYQQRLLAGAWPPLLGETAEQAHVLADLLGDHHDLAVLGEDLAARGFAPAWSAELSAALAARQGELAAAAFALAARLYAEKPRAYRRRMRGYWRAWRG